jgi:hypothetical protein
VAGFMVRRAALQFRMTADGRAPPRARAESISSMQMIAGATFRASANYSRTRLAPTANDRLDELRSNALK